MNHSRGPSINPRPAVHLYVGTAEVKGTDEELAEPGLGGTARSFAPSYPNVSNDSPTACIHL